MSDVHFDAPNRDEVKEVIAMQGATIIAATFIEKGGGWFVEKDTKERRIRTELLKDLIKEVKAALLDK